MREAMRAPYVRIAILGSLALGCDAPQQATAEVPERQFVAERVRLMQSRDGVLLWSGTVAVADGDFAAADVEQVALTRHPQKPSEPQLELVAPRGSLAFDDGKAHFDDVVITRPDGARLSAGAADYDEAAQHIVAKGPILLEEGRLTIRAASGVVRLDSETMELAGPILGTISPPRARPPR